MENKTLKFYENQDNLGDTQARYEALDTAKVDYQNEINDKNRLSMQSADGSLVTKWIENRIGVGEDRESGKGKNVFKIETVKQPEGDYEKDLEKLKALTPDELKKLLKGVEEKSREGKGLFSKGNLLNGYAIDTKTLKSLHTTHHNAIDDLTERILDHLRYSDPPVILDDREIKRGIVGGFVYPQVSGFKTPIVKFFPFGLEEMNNRVPQEDVEKIANHIKKERKLLPISSHFEVL